MIGADLLDGRVVLEHADGAGTDGVLEGVLHRERETDRDDHQLGEAQPAMPQRLPHDAVLQPAGEPADQHHEQPACPEVHAVDVDQLVAEDAAEAHLLGVREVRQAGGAVDEGEPDRREGQQEAEPDAVGGALEQLVDLALARLVVGGADLDQGRRGREELGLDRLLAGGLEVLGERRLVDLDGVRALLVDLEVPLASLVGRDLLLGPGLVGDHDGDVGEDVILGPQGAGDAGRGLGRQAQGASGVRRCRPGQQEQ